MPAVSLSPAVRRLIQGLRRAWAEHNIDAYITGGFLRDTLLDRPVRDIDIAISGDPVLLARQAADALGGHFFPLDEERGIMRIVLPSGAPVSYIDVTRLRGDIRNDLAERDFAIDAMALPLVSADSPQALIDPFSGVDDVARRIVRAVSNRLFQADGLRLLRAVRLCAELDFTLDESTAALIRRDAACIDNVSPERQRDELMRIFATNRSASTLRLLDDLALLERLLPEVTACRGVSQPKEHYWDVFTHLLETVAALDFMLAESEPADRREAAFQREIWGQLSWLPELRAHFREEPIEGRSRAALLKLTGLFHDIAKPETKAPDHTGRIRFLGHPSLGAEKAAAVLRRLRFSGSETRLVARIIDQHLRPGQMGSGGPPTRHAVYRFFRDADEVATDILFLTLADYLAARGPRLRFTTWRGAVAYVAYIFARHHLEHAEAAPIRLITGDDIMTELGIRPGPLVGRLLKSIEEARALGEISSREQALALARSLLLAEKTSKAASS